MNQLPATLRETHAGMADGLTERQVAVGMETRRL